MANVSLEDRSIELGRRIERLLYFGSIILLLSLINLYFVQASKLIGKESAASVNKIIQIISNELPELRALHSKLPTRSGSTSKGLDALQNEAIRKNLGLPLNEKSETQSETYYDRLSKIKNTANIELNSSSETLATLDASATPDQILEALQTRSKALGEEALNVWGIESPSQVLLKYGEGEYLFPPSAIANILTHATSLLFVLWLASFQMTRQRELMIIKSLRSLDSVFPHIINVFVVNYFRTGVSAIDEKKYKKRSAMEGWIERCFPILVRGLAVLLFPLPIASALTYSLIELNTSINQETLAGLSYLAIFGTWSALTILYLTFQEYIIPKDKEFYA
jgi:hypothetical protein